MATFAGKGREQAERVLTYAACGGTAALVEVATGQATLSVGKPEVPGPRWRAAREIHDDDADLLVIEPGFIVGRVGDELSLVVRLDADVPPSAVCVERVQKACRLLEEMLRPSGAPSSEPSGGSGAPAEVAVWKPTPQ